MVMVTGEGRQATWRNWLVQEPGGWGARSGDGFPRAGVFGGRYQRGLRRFGPPIQHRASLASVLVLDAHISNLIASLRATLFNSLTLPTPAIKSTQTDCPDPPGDMAEMCTEMYMDGCDVYLGWCRQAMTWQAAGHGSMSYYCRGAEPYGGGGGSGIPPMLMFFHQRVREVLLFRPWLPTTTGEGWRVVMGLSTTGPGCALVGDDQSAILVFLGTQPECGPFVASTRPHKVLVNVCARWAYMHGLAVQFK